MLAATTLAQVVDLPIGLLLLTAAGAITVANLPDIDAPPQDDMTVSSGDTPQPTTGYGAYDPFARARDRQRHQANRRYNHRGWPHSLLIAGGAALILPLISFLIFGYPDTDATVSTTLEPFASFGKDPTALISVFTSGAAAGYLSHLFLDALTTKGIWLFRPNGVRISLPIVKKNRMPESLVLCCLYLALVPTLILPIIVSAVPA